MRCFSPLTSSNKTSKLTIEGMIDVITGAYNLSTPTRIILTSWISSIISPRLIVLA